ncbi:MAG: ComEA family DNA-binding protein [Candidatus Margulisiibacteriota bacterium]
MLEELLKKNKLCFIGFVCLILSISLGVRLFHRPAPSSEEPSLGVEVLKTPSAVKKEENFILVHISGAVNKRGVYRLSAGSRTIDAVGKAGGFLKSADVTSLNLSQQLKDGQKIDIPERNMGFAGSAGCGTKININTASASEMEKIPGVGAATAKKILECRIKNGAFRSYEDLSKIKGFGKKKIDKIKDEISL